ncbi:fibronectin type III domain-containing protein [Fulvivirga sediminis]|uniref:Fibronectin type-III domain-containing protein n=1 Tax=Fulvivirga sediminis TaxID=2803949 RepID=A0A937K1G0_9BACT|nr:hypothetical protein [Fulvivirga sediminis]MBL3658569.1 hypothetical protein [Fulvivirga sediminis]
MNKLKGILIGMRIVCLSLIIVSLAVLKAKSQNNEGDAIKVIALPYDGQILLRWAPNSPVAWQLLNKYGYRLERVTMMRNGKALKQPETIVLWDSPHMPAAVADWEELADRDNFAGVAAQAIYGETFELSDNYRSDMVSVINKSRELEQRYSFALFAADMSVEAAEKSALFYKDTSVKAGERYLYRVHSAVPEEKLSINTGIVYTGLDEEIPLPTPQKPAAEFSDLMVSLEWDRDIYSDTYTAFEIQRAQVGGEFKDVSDIPFVSASSDPSQGHIMHVIDSLPQNNVEYRYRIRGVTPFGQKGPYSNEISGIGRDKLIARPSIVSGNAFNDMVVLKWEFDERYLYQIEKFQLLRAENDKTSFTLLKDDLDLEKGSIIDDNPLPTNYYQIKGIGKYTQEVFSMPYMVLLIDSIPPVVPQGVSGKMDTTGLVTLNWTPNTEKDLYGYRVFRSNFENQEYIQITKAALKDTVFYDTLSRNNLTPNIYYKVVAVDTHYNPSGYSESAAIKRPDFTPPVSAVLTGIKPGEGNITLTWIPGSSEDAKDQLIYRQSNTEARWALMQVLAAQDTTWQDSGVNTELTYQYTIITIDESGLESTPAQPLSASPLPRKVQRGIGKLFYSQKEDEQSITLGWEYDQPGVERFIIYRAVGEAPITPLGSVNSDQKKYTDNELKKGEVYRYQVGAVFTDGSSSALSEEVVLKAN